MGKAVKDRACPDPQCAMFGKIGKGNVTFHGFLRLKRGSPCNRNFSFRDVYATVARFVPSAALPIRVRWRRYDHNRRPQASFLVGSAYLGASFRA